MLFGTHRRRRVLSPLWGETGGVIVLVKQNIKIPTGEGTAMAYLNITHTEWKKRLGEELFEMPDPEEIDKWIEV